MSLGYNRKKATQQSVHLTLGSLRTSQAFSHAFSFFWLDGFAVPAPAQVTQTVRAHVFSFLLKIESLVKYLFFVVARNRIFPAIVFSVASRSFVFFNLLVFSS